MGYLKVFFITAVILCNTAKAQEEPIKILVFQSYHETLPWTKQILNGIDSFKKSYKGDIEFYMETIDYIRLKEQMEPKKWEEYLRYKYQGLRFDGILVDTIFATQVFNHFSNKLYKDIPKIYFSTSNIKGEGNQKVIKEIEEDMMKKSISLAQKHNPGLQNIYVIKADKGGKVLEKLLLKELNKTPFKITYIDNFSLEELETKLAKLPKNSAVFYILTFYDKTGKLFIPKEFLSKIAKVSNAPIYSFWSTFIGTGTAGGYMIDGENAVQEILKSLLNHIKTGKFIDNISICNTYVDYKVMERFNIDKSMNPKDTIFFNKPVPVWEDYPKESFFAISTILLLSLLLFLGIILKIRDEKIKKMEESMLIQSKQAAMGEMISVIAHQWRQPLNNIAAMVQTILLKYMKNKLDDKIMEKFKKDVLKQIRYMSTTIDDFRNFYKPGKKQRRFNIKNELLKITDLVSLAYQKENIRIEKSFMDDFFVIGYPNEMGQCFLIILQNAKDALSEIKDQKDKKIQISLISDEKGCTIIFEDSGNGIPKNIIKKVFDPYFSTKDIKQGTGIGLYMAKMIIEKHFNGTIKALNGTNGAKFEIRIYSC